MTGVKSALTAVVVTGLLVVLTAAGAGAAVVVSGPLQRYRDGHTAMAGGESRKTADMRATRYTPAVTIVAAWINAETGVGPAIASGSQT